MNTLIEKLHAWKCRLQEKIEINLLLTGREFDTSFEEFCCHLEAELPNATIIKEIDRAKALPEIRLAKNLVYSALPLGMELEPFLEALALVNVEGLKLPDALQSEEFHHSLRPKADTSLRPCRLQEKLSRIEIQAELKLYVAQNCPHCPAMVRAMVSLSAACENIRLTIVDGTLFPEEASKDGVMSAPCLILDRDTQWTGNVDPVEIVDMILNQDPSNLSASSLKRILEQGKASWIAATMMEADAIFPAFIELLIHTVWSVRLGAMVVLEEITEEMPALASRITEPLWLAFEGAETTIKGDILYALGEAGDQGIANRLKQLAATLEDDELKEAAAEALAALASRSQGCNKPLGV